MSLKPWAKKARASARVETVSALPSPAVCMRATSTHLCVLTWGLSFAPDWRTCVAIFDALRFMRPASSSRHGVFNSLRLVIIVLLAVLLAKDIFITRTFPNQDNNHRVWPWGDRNGRLDSAHRPRIESEGVFYHSRFGIGSDA